MPSRSLGMSVVVVLTLIVACNDRSTTQRGPSTVSTALSRLCCDSTVTRIAFAEITDFVWERVYFFGPYATSLEVDETLGFSWAAYPSSGIEVLDGIVLVRLPDGSFVSLSELQIGETNLFKHGTWLSKLLGNLIPCTGEKLCGG